MDYYEQRFRSIILEKRWLMDALRTVRSLDLPDWYIAAGAIRNTVWEVLHDFNGAQLNDVDVIYFDSLDIQGLKEGISEFELRKTHPSVKWEVVNQARGHLFQHGDEISRPPVKSSCESIAYWSETPTCVGVRLEQDNSLSVCAPHGLADLIELRVKPVPRPYRDLTLYRRRIKEKKWDERWPKLQIEKFD